MKLSAGEIDAFADSIAEKVLSRISERLESIAPKDVMNVKEVAKLLGCSVATVERRTMSGDIPSFLEGRLRRYLRSEVLAARGRTMPQIDLRAVVPKELIDERRWVLWKYVDKKRRKPPCGLNGDQIDGQNKANWLPFETCYRVLELDQRKPKASRKFEGLGFVLGDGFAGIDLDDAYSSLTGLTKEAEKIVRSVNTYWEVSPSGTGVKGFGRINKDSPKRTLKKKLRTGETIEIYTEGRYFTVTGQFLELGE